MTEPTKEARELAEAYSLPGAEDALADAIDALCAQRTAAAEKVVEAARRMQAHRYGDETIDAFKASDDMDMALAELTGEWSDAERPAPEPAGSPVERAMAEAERLGNLVHVATVGGATVPAITINYGRLRTIIERALVAERSAGAEEERVAYARLAAEEKNCRPGVTNFCHWPDGCSDGCRYNRARGEK